MVLLRVPAGWALCSVLSLHYFSFNFARITSGFGFSLPDEELRLREVKEFAPVHTAGKWQG